MSDGSNNYWAMPEPAVKGLYASQTKSKMNVALEARGRQDDFLVSNGVALIEVVGPISTYKDFFSYYFGGASIQGIVGSINAAVDDARIERIILRIDSPGGTALGLTELTDFVYEVSQKKTIVSWVNMCCSAAFLLASATNKIYTNPLGLIGSIGVIYSEMRRDGLLTITSQNAPLKDARLETGDKEEKASILKMINDMEDVFLNRLSKYRKVPKNIIINEWGRGATLVGEKAVDVGMVDQVISYNEFMKEQMAMAGANSGMTQEQIQALVDGSVAAALEQQTRKFQTEMIEVENRAKQQQQAEDDRKSGIRALFDLFRVETNYQGQYAQLEARCLADSSITVEQARNEVIKLRSSFVFGAIPQVPSSSDGFQQPTKITAKQKIDKLLSEGKTRGQAITYLAQTDPEAHKEYINNLNGDVSINWTPEGQI